MSRRYKVEGTREFLYWAIGLFLVSLLFVRDGWFPPERVLEKHPPGTDSFYLFNQSTAIIMLIAAAVCGYIHRVVK